MKSTIEIRRLCAGLLAPLGIITAAIPFANATEAPSPYIQLGAGANFMGALPFQGTAGATTLHSELDFNTGPLFAGSVGYAFGNGVRTEFELGYRSANGENITVPSGANVTLFNTNVHTYTYMVNALYDFDLSHMDPALAAWSPHIGVGVGAANINASNAPSTTAFAYQGIVGIEYEYSPRLRFGLDYRYLGSNHASLNFTQNGATIGHSGHSNIQDNAVMATLRWNFFYP